MVFAHSSTTASQMLGFKTPSRLSQMRKAGKLEGCYIEGNEICKWLWDVDLLKKRLDDTLAPWNRGRRGKLPGTKLDDKPLSKTAAAKLARENKNPNNHMKRQIIDGIAPEIKTIGYAKAREINEEYKAALTKLDYEERSGKLIKLEKAKEIAAYASQTFKENCLAIADRCSALCAAENDPFTVKQILIKEINFILDNVSARMKQFDAIAARA